MPGLGEGTPELHPDLWGMTTANCVRHYINAWYTLYQGKPHMPIPVIHGMVNWLRANVPESNDRPTLVHGDIGLHNLLFDQGRLSSVLDWEFAHIGDPAEDLGIIYTVMREQLDWDSFLDEYSKAGGKVPSMSRIRYFEILMNFRNLMVASIALGQFASGQLREIRYGVFATRFIPHYIERVSTLIREWKA
jgi:aminoglycoside phosphotransferase (APT) family kinase protein